MSVALIVSLGRWPSHFSMHTSTHFVSIMSYWLAISYWNIIRIFEIKLFFHINISLHFHYWKLEWASCFILSVLQLLMINFCVIWLSASVFCLPFHGGNTYCSTWCITNSAIVVLQVIKKIRPSGDIMVLFNVTPMH